MTQMNGYAAGEIDAEESALIHELKDYTIPGTWERVGEILSRIVEIELGGMRNATVSLLHQLEI